MYGWNNPNYEINMIPNNPADRIQGGMVDLINNYREISIEQICQFDETYINTKTRAA